MIGKIGIAGDASPGQSLWEVIVLAPHRILVPIDFSECSLAALAYAAFVAEHFGSHVHVLHVLPVSAEGYGPISVETDPQQDAELRERVALYLNRLQSPVRQAIQVHAVMHPDPAAAILDAIDEGKFDLVIMGAWGTQQDAPSVRHYPGRTATRVAEGTACRVERVACPPSTSPMPRLPFLLRPFCSPVNLSAR